MPISAAEPLLDVAGLSTGYGKISVLRGIDLTVGANEVVALLGPNGAGKTTLLRSEEHTSELQSLSSISYAVS